MQKINRRKFLSNTSMAAGAAFVLSQLPKQIFAAAKANNMPIGFQSWPIKDMLAKDFPGTLKIMAGMDYKLIELCSPQGYKDIGFGFLV
ncbi:MAG: twin-arginine translocation signal domain-containing protein, partial [Parafilimonas sp.]